jgi:membrane-associated phospholipid phosphatase
MGHFHGIAGAQGEQPMNPGRPWKRAALWLAFLGPFFFISYGLAGAWTARLPFVPSFWYEWEKQIPFLPWTIVPYMSIDAFYAISLFLCATRVELDTHAKRLLAATLISVAGFLLFPLRTGFVRPETSGLFGMLFDLLTDVDKPFNEAPSLHISLLLLLWQVYARHLRGWAKWAMHLWFTLIGISVFTTFQHHLIDGISGAIAGIVCVYLFPDAPQQWQAEPPRPAGRLAGTYALGALCCLVPPLLWGGWSWLFLWPAASLLLVAGAYRWWGVAAFQKATGGHSWAARALLLPYQGAAWLSSRWWTRNGRACVQVCPGVWLGRAPGQGDWHAAPFAAVLDLTAELAPSPEVLGRHYACVPMLDLVPPSPQQLTRAVDALARLRQHGPVLVHCALGYSRSALVVSSWLLRHGIAATPEAALSLVRSARPQVVLNPASLALLNDG